MWATDGFYYSHELRICTITMPKKIHVHDVMIMVEGRLNFLQVMQELFKTWAKLAIDMKSFGRRFLPKDLNTIYVDRRHVISISLDIEQSSYEFSGLTRWHRSHIVPVASPVAGSPGGGESRTDSGETEIMKSQRRVSWLSKKRTRISMDYHCFGP